MGMTAGSGHPSLSLTENKGVTAVNRLRT